VLCKGAGNRGRTVTPNNPDSFQTCIPVTRAGPGGAACQSECEAALALD
jgi:hypothetical protein